MPRKLPGHPKPYAQLTPAGQLRRLGRMVRKALLAYDLDVTSVRLLNDGENTTYDVRVTPRRSSDPGRYLMRLHRPRTEGARHVASELSWMQALREETALSVPEIILTRDGEPLQVVSLEGVPRERVAVLFNFLDGRAYSGYSLATIERIAEMTAKLHRHGLDWTPPESFKRFIWNAEGLLGEQANWGAPLRTPGIKSRQRSVLTRACEALHEQLAVDADDSTHFGLIHADLHPYNLLMRKGRINIIDFDDCGVGFLHYDIGVFFNAIRIHDHFDACFDRFCEVYSRHMPLQGLDRDRLSMFMLTRRLAQLGWLAGRSDEPDTAEYLPGAIERATEHARVFLSRLG